MGPIDLKTDPLLFVNTFKFHACLANGLFFDTAKPQPQLPESIEPECTQIWFCFNVTCFQNSCSTSCAVGSALRNHILIVFLAMRQNAFNAILRPFTIHSSASLSDSESESVAVVVGLPIFSCDFNRDFDSRFAHSVSTSSNSFSRSTVN